VLIVVNAAAVASRAYHQALLLETQAEFAHAHQQEVPSIALHYTTGCKNNQYNQNEKVLLERKILYLLTLNLKNLSKVLAQKAESVQQDRACN
jgi:hypothetical protein